MFYFPQIDKATYNSGCTSWIDILAVRTDASYHYVPQKCWEDADKEFTNEYKYLPDSCVHKKELIWMLSKDLERLEIGIRGKGNTLCDGELRSIADE